MAAGGELLVLQHDTRTPPGALADLLESRASRRAWRLVDLGGGDDVPVPDGAAGLLVLGGPMGVGDVDDHPWMSGELELLRDAVEAELPVLGICLGAQLLTAALGGEVTARDVPEIAFLALHRTETAHDDEVFAGWPDGMSVLLYHQDQIAELPDGAEPMLGGSDGVPAWRVGSAHAVQFHPEVDGDLLASWNADPLFQEELDRAGVDGDALVDEARRRERFLLATGMSLVGRWLDAVVA